MIIGAAALGAAIHIRNGLLDPLALALVGAAVAAAAVAFIASSDRPIPQHHERGIRVLLGVAIAASVVVMSRSEPAYCCVSAAEVPTRWLFDAGVIAAGVVALAGLLPLGRMATVQVGLLLALYAALALWITASAPSPVSYMDVYLFQHDAAAALLAGSNPYSMTFPNLYGSGAGYYPPGFATEERTMFGFPYPPLSLLLATIGHAVGDIRFAHLVAVTLAAAMIALARPSAIARGAAGMLLLTPRSLYVVESSWTEPFAAMFFALAVTLAVRRPPAAAIAVGLAAAVKQYVLPIAPLALLLRPSAHRRDWRAAAADAGIALATVAVVTLPIALLDLSAFGRSVVDFHLLGLFRTDSLSFNAARVVWTGATPIPTWVSLVAAAAIMGIAIVRRSRGPGVFAATSAVVLLTLFVLGRQAFGNYYYLVIAVMCCGIATLPGSGEARESRSA